MKTFFFRLTVVMAISVLEFFSMICSVNAAELRATPSIRLGQGWNSNIFQTSTNEVSDFYFTAAPGLTLAAATPTFSLQLTGGMEGRWYYDHPDISSSKYSKYLNLASPEGWKATDRVSLIPMLYFLESSSQTQRSLLVTTDPSLPTPGITEYGLRKVRNAGASVGLRYQATPTLETDITLFVAKQEYPDQVSGASGSSSWGGDVLARYIFSPRSSGGMYIAANDSNFKDAPDSRVMAVGLIGRHKYSPSFTLDARLGVAFAHQSASSIAQAQNTQAPAGTITLGYTDNTFHANLNGNVGYSGLTGIGQIARLWTVGLDIGDQYTQRWSWSLAGIYQKSFTVFQESETSANGVVGSAGIHYAPWEWGSFDLTGSATRSWSTGLSPIVDYSAVLGVTVGKTYTAF
jgi:hypothetical protein